MAANWNPTTIDQLKAPQSGSIAIGPFGSRMKSDCYVSAGVPVIRGNNISDTRALRGEFVYVTPEFADGLGNAIVYANDLFFPHRGAIGQVGLVPKDKTARYALSSSLMKLTCDQSKADPLFLFYFFRSPIGRHELLKNASTVGTPGIGQPLSSLKSIKVSLPPLPCQKAIATVLGALDDKIELNRRINATLEAMARALFQSWFVDFDPVRAKAEGRPCGGLDESIAALFPAQFQASELGEIPLGWQVSDLGDYLDVLETGRRPKGGVGKYTSGIPSIGAENILRAGEYDFGKTKFIPEDFYTAMKSGRVQNYDVLLYKDGGKPGVFLPRVSMFGEGFPFETYTINEHVFRMRSGAIGQPLLYFQIGSERLLNDLHNRGGKAAIPGINQTDVRTLRILISSKKVRDAFNHACQPLLAAILQNAKQSRTLATLRDTLLPKLLSGELNVGGIPDQTARMETLEQYRATDNDEDE